MLNKKLILFMPSIDGGGVEKNLFIISNYLIQKIPNIIIISFDNKFNQKFNNKIKFVYFTKKKLKINKYFKYLACLILLIKEMIFQRAVVLSFQANIYSIILCKIFQTPIISRSNSSPSGWGGGFFKKLIFKNFLKLSNKIIVNSKDFKREIDRKFNVNSTLIYNPLDIKNILKKSKKKVSTPGFNKAKLKIINVARFTDQKDHLTLLKSFKLVSDQIDCKLLLIGYGKNISKIKKFIYDNKLKNKIFIKQVLSDPYNYISKADIFILSSIFEGLPNVLLEAMTLKKVIFSTNCPTGPSEILGNGKYGTLFKIKDHISLSRLILKYYKNKNFFTKKLKPAFKSLDRFDQKINCKKYYDVILSEFRKIN